MNRLLVGAADHTNLLLHFARADFPGGLTLIDPDGPVAEALANIVPVKDTHRVLYFDPSDREHPVPLNVLHKVSEERRPKLAEDICAYFEAMWPGGWGAQSDWILLNSLRLLMDAPGSTLLGVAKLLKDDAYRTKCLKWCADPLVRDFWERTFPEWDDKKRREAIMPLQNKIGGLLSSPDRRNILCQKHCTPLDGKIVIANLNRTKVGRRTALLLGSLLVARSSGPLYIANLGFFASDHLDELFFEDRTTASVRALPKRYPALLDELLSIEEKFVFAAPPSDAEQLAFSVGAMNIRQLTELAPDEVFHRGDVSKPELVASLKRLKAIRNRTRGTHTVLREKVEADIERFLS